jgi:hypothetical protein
VENETTVRTDQGTKMQEKETLDERLPALFEPDTLLPIQYFEAMRRKHLLEGEKRLILSVLEDAVECFMKCIDSPTNKGQRLFREAEEWINLEDKHWVFSFDNVCDMLDINPEYMRRGLREWKQRKLEAIANAAAAAVLAPAEPQAVLHTEQVAPAVAAKPKAESAHAKPKTAAKVLSAATQQKQLKRSHVAASQRTASRFHKARA